MNLILLNDENLRKINVGYEYMTLEALEKGIVYSPYLMRMNTYFKNKQVNQLAPLIYSIAFHEAVKNSLQAKEPEIQLDYEILQRICSQKNLRKIKACINQLVKINLLQQTEKGYLVMHPDINVGEWQQEDYKKDMEELEAIGK